MEEVAPRAFEEGTFFGAIDHFKIAKSRVPLHRLRIVRFSNGVRYALTLVRYGNMTYVIGVENAEVAHSLVGYVDEVK
ncbi:hypothetical protein Tco_0846685, partial [Tanacetum coccineum]